MFTSETATFHGRRGSGCVGTIRGNAGICNILLCCGGDEIFMIPAQGVNKLAPWNVIGEHFAVQSSRPAWNDLGTTPLLRDGPTRSSPTYAA